MDDTEDKNPASAPEAVPAAKDPAPETAAPEPAASKPDEPSAPKPADPAAPEAPVSETPVSETPLAADETPVVAVETPKAAVETPAEASSEDAAETPTEAVKEARSEETPMEQEEETPAKEATPQPADAAADGPGEMATKDSAPETSAPEPAAPEPAEPETAAPETAAPEPAVPEPAAPEAPASETKVAAVDTPTAEVDTPAAADDTPAEAPSKDTPAAETPTEAVEEAGSEETPMEQEEEAPAAEETPQPAATAADGGPGEKESGEQEKEKENDKDKDKEATVESGEAKAAEEEEATPSADPENQDKETTPVEEEEEGDNSLPMIESVSGAVEEDDASDRGEKDTTMDTTATAEEDVVELDDDDDEAGKKRGDDSEKESSNDEAAKKPMLKLASFATSGGGSTNGTTESTPPSSSAHVLPTCSECSKPITAAVAAFVWETMQFCDQECLKKNQDKYSKCSTCGKEVQVSSMGKYCVRFGCYIKQFCSNACLEDHKKALKVCTYCQKDISGDGGFLAPIGEKGQFKDFCAQECLKKYEAMEGKVPENEEKEKAPCAVCQQEKDVGAELLRGGTEESPNVKLCSRPCLSAFVFANSVDALQCDLCRKDYDLKANPDIVEGKQFVVYHDGKASKFCGSPCQNAYVMKNRKIVPCAWCKVKKYNFDMIEWWMNETTMNTFCSVNCVDTFRTNRSNNPANGQQSQASTATQAMPVIQSVSSLAGAGELPAQPDRLPNQPVPASQLGSSPPAVQQVTTQVQTIREMVKDTMVQIPEPAEVRNKATLTKPFMQTKGISCRPHTTTRATQTDIPTTPTLVPICVPAFMPMPMQMYNAPYPVPIPVPVPVPVPVFVPTSRNSYRGVMKKIKKILAKMPSDPFEAELLALAGGLVGKKDGEEQFSDDSDYMATDDEDEANDGRGQGGAQQPQVPQEDFEREISGGRVVPKPLPLVTPSPAVSPAPGVMRQQHAARNTQTPDMVGGQKRRYSQTREGEENGEGWNWQQRRTSQSRSRSRSSRPKQQRIEPHQNAAPAVPQPPKERPDKNHHLKFTYGVNAWKHWVVQKNAELEKLRAQGKYMKTFETDILKLRADELNFTLCMFVKEVKKPNGDPYAPDSIFYLTLGIQEYLFENSRIDNIFTDQYYETFTSALHEVVNDFKLPVNELGYFVTRIEEEHLWEAKQLGAHSPQVLLNTLIYFNTKFFMLKTLDTHKKLSFSHIMKHWKKQTPAQAAANKSKQILLRYYPPSARQPSGRGGREERKCYEQQENSENPLRCPVKLYEFYLSKCPENVKTRNDMFYLQPERSCVPDSPVWYSTGNLIPHAIEKTLNRILMVREIQEHMLADASS